MLKKNLNRRLFLRGVGGATVAAPFLPSVAERTARAQGQGGEIPRRVIMMFTHYGALTDRWFPDTAHGALTADSWAGTTAEAFGPLADKMLMPRGIRAMNEWTSNMNRGQGNDTHTQVVGTYFTCQPVTPNSNDPFDFGTPKFNAQPMDRSLDHVMAEQVSPSGTPLVMRVAGTSENAQSAVSYSRAEEMFPGVGSPAQAFNAISDLFSTGDGGEPMNEATYRMQAGASIIDIVREDLLSLQRFDMSMADERRIEAWINLLEVTAQGVQALAECNAEAASSLLGLSDATVGGGGGVGGDAVTNMVTETLDQADLFGNIAVLAAMCDANRVMLLKYPGNYVYRGLGLDTENHSISHRVGGPGMGGTCVSGVNDQIMTMDRYYSEKFAKLVSTLDSIEEGDGSVLDNSAAVWFNEMSDGNAHNLNNLPIIQAGSCGGYFKTGQAINVEDGDPNLSKGNSEAQCLNGGEIPFGQVTASATAADVANAPINKYFCNLMNAIGVKAGADGFPQDGGSGEVTHFGMYDRTEDFIGGGTNPAMINDPGEFTDLKA